MTKPPIDNIVLLHPVKGGKKVSHDDDDPARENPHGYVLSSLDKVQEEIRNNPKIKGVFMVSFDEEGSADNWIMGDVSITTLYTSLGLLGFELLKYLNGPEDDGFMEV
jgi:hypothetical protein